LDGIEWMGQVKCAVLCGWTGTGTKNRNKSQKAGEENNKKSGQWLSEAFANSIQITCKLPSHRKSGVHLKIAKVA